MSELEPAQSRDLRPLFLVVVAAYGASFIGWFGSQSGLGFWYLTIAKPSWSPPVWLFQPAWTVALAFVIYGAWLVWNSDNPSRKLALAVFFGQLFLAAGWPWLFFYGHQLYASSLAIDLLWLASAAMGMLFFRVRPSAGMCSLPYLAWIAYLASMNYSVWHLSQR
jgi:tryptophan-rich sensory protein